MGLLKSQPGSGWGGARVGAGRKPEPAPLAVIRPGVTGESGEGEDPKAEDLSQPPADLPEVQQEFWRTYAPFAIERKTLTASTVPAFLLLCELYGKKAMVSGLVNKGELGGLRVYM